jgi:nitroreductase
MQKPAPTDVPVHELVRIRWSPRAFADKPVAPDVLHSLFEAARWAPSSFNYQPWAYIVGTKDDSENFAEILSTFVEFNVGWAKHAPVLALSVAQLKTPKEGMVNRHAFHDVGSATSQLTLEANSRGLFVHQMAGFDPQSLPEPLRQRELAPRTRKPLSEFVMTGGWGHTAPFISK